MKLSEYPWKGLVCRWKSDTFNYFFCILKTTQLSGLDCYQSIGFYLKKHRLMFLETNWIKCHLMLSPESLNGKTHQAFCIFKYSHRDCFIQLKFILLIIKHLKEHRTKCNLKQHGRIRVHRHSYKLNAASKIVFRWGGVERWTSNRSWARLFNSEVEALPLCSYARHLTPEEAAGALLEKLRQPIDLNVPDSGCGALRW